MHETHLNRRTMLGLLAAGPMAVSLFPHVASATDSEQTAELPRVLMPIGDATEAMDTLYPYFRIAEDDWRDVEIEALNEDLDVIGIFHSHPDHPPVASPRDLAWASWPGYSYLITEVKDGAPAASRSWQLKEDRTGFVEEALESIISGD